MNKIGEIVVLILLPFCSLSQGAVIGMPELFVLYRGYYNVIEIANNGVSDPITLISNDVNFTEKDSFQYAANVSSNAKSTFVYTINTRTKDTLDKAFFRIRNLPPPDIYLCNVRNGDTVVFQKNMLLSCQFAPTITLNYYCQMIETKVLVNGQLFKLNGDFFSDTLKQAIENNIRNSSTRCIDIEINTVIKSTDCRPQKKSAQFTILK
jgi:GldM C-terminal domain